MTKTIVSYEDALKNLKRGDVLLFRSPKSIFSVGWWITAYTRGIYSHVGIADINGQPMILEQREFIGGRSISLKNAVKEYPNGIDVYRVNPTVFNTKESPNWKSYLSDNNIFERKSFNEEVANAVIETAKELTGIKYGWSNILKIFLSYFPFFRLLKIGQKKSEIEIEAKDFVCSTVVAYSFRKNYTDLVPNISDVRTTPDDLGRSGLLNYLFTIGEINE